MSSSFSFDDVPGSLPEDRVPQDVDVESVRAQALAALQSGNNTTDKFTDDAIWRDLLCMTGRAATLSGRSHVSKTWTKLAARQRPTDIQALEARVSRPAHGTSWVDVPFTFRVQPDDGLPGSCSGNVSLVPGSNGRWEIWKLTTMLESLRWPWES